MTNAGFYFVLAAFALAACGADEPPVADTLAATGIDDSDVWEIEPQYPLWSDGAEKRRWLWLPPGTQINTDDMDNWVFPVGTKAWKEFSRDGLKIETRLLEKRAEGDWAMVAYAWNADQTEAVPAPAGGVVDALGTGHDIPSGEDCEACHANLSDTLIGVSAIQLDHGGDGLTLPTLDGHGMLTTRPGGSYPLPGDESAQQALGYLHANCGNCHNDRNSHNPLRLWLTTGELDSVAATPTYRTTVGVETSADPLPGTDATTIIVPGDPAASLLYLRMTRRTKGAMPWLGSEQVDSAGSAAVANWINAL